MTQDLHALLLAHDSANPAEWEAPPTFFETGRELLLKKVQVLIKQIEEKLKLPVQYDDRYQDASCVADLYLTTTDDQEAIVRFSNFGRMAVIFRWASEQRLPIRSPLEPMLLPLVEQGGFQPIPPDLLTRPYDGLYGRCRGTFNDPMTWFERYFDYL